MGHVTSLQQTELYVTIRRGRWRDLDHARSCPLPLERSGWVPRIGEDQQGAAGPQHDGAASRSATSLAQAASARGHRDLPEDGDHRPGRPSSTIQPHFGVSRCSGLRPARKCGETGGAATSAPAAIS